MFDILFFLKKNKDKPNKKLKIIENSFGISVVLPDIPKEKIISSEEMSRKLRELWLREVDINTNHSKPRT